MAVLTRTNQIAYFCHVGDPACKPGSATRPEPDWVSAEGQPVDATRFGVRLLSHAEIGGADTTDSYLVGWVSLDGEPVDVQQQTPEWRREVANLIVALSLCPFRGLLSRSAEQASKVSTAGA